MNQRFSFITKSDVADMKELRAKGRTLKEIASYIGCNYTTVSRWLSGIPKPKKPDNRAVSSKKWRDKVMQDPERRAELNEKARIRQRKYRAAIRERNLREAAE